MDSALKEALDGPGPFIAAWDLDGRTEDNWTLTLFSLASGAPNKVLTQDIGHDDRRAAQDDLRNLGAQIGFHDADCEHVWVREGDTFTVWSFTARTFEADAQTVCPTGGKAVARDAVTEATAFAGGEEHGVRLETTSGDRIVVAIEQAVSVLGDPFVTRSEVVYEAAWASLLARQLGEWLGVPHDLVIE